MPQVPKNPAVRSLVTAINSGDRAAFLAALTPDAVLTDDGTERVLNEWIDKEIFDANGHLTVQREDRDGLKLKAAFRNDTWGEMSTKWSFQLTADGSKIAKIETGQA